MLIRRDQLRFSNCITACCTVRMRVNARGCKMHLDIVNGLGIELQDASGRCQRLRDRTITNPGTLPPHVLQPPRLPQHRLPSKRLRRTHRNRRCGIHLRHHHPHHLRWRRPTFVSCKPQPPAQIYQPNSMHYSTLLQAHNTDNPFYLCRDACFTLPPKGKLVVLNNTTRYTPQ